MYAINVRKIGLSRDGKTLSLYMNGKHGDLMIPYSFNELVAVIDSTDCKRVLVKGDRTPYIGKLVGRLRKNIDNKYIYFRKI